MRDATVINALLVLKPDPQVTAETGERLARQLRAEVGELDVESVTPAGRDSAPAGAKAADPVTVGALVVAFSASGGVFVSLIDTVRGWLDRHAGRHRVSVTIDGDTLELDRASEAERHQLVEAFVRRHSRE